jgi:hypothetical protein
VRLSAVEGYWLERNANSIRQGALGALTREVGVTSFIIRT